MEPPKLKTITLRIEGKMGRELPFGEGTTVEDAKAALLLLHIPLYELSFDNGVRQESLELRKKIAQRANDHIAACELAQLRFGQYQRVPDPIRVWHHDLPSGTRVTLSMKKGNMTRAGTINHVGFEYFLTTTTRPDTEYSKDVSFLRIGLYQYMNRAYAFMAIKFRHNARKYVHPDVLPEIDDKAARKIGLLMKEAHEFRSKVVLGFCGRRW